MHEKHSCWIWAILTGNCDFNVDLNTAGNALLLLVLLLLAGLRAVKDLEHIRVLNLLLTHELVALVKRQS